MSGVVKQPIADADGFIDSMPPPELIKQPKPAAMSDAEKIAQYDKAYQYLWNLFTDCAPQCTPSDKLVDLCTQIDNLIAGYATELDETSHSWRDEE